VFKIENSVLVRIQLKRVRFECAFRKRLKKKRIMFRPHTIVSVQYKPFPLFETSSPIRGYVYATTTADVGVDVYRRKRSFSFRVVPFHPHLFTT
jgi:hypothetical protein